LLFEKYFKLPTILPIYKLINMASLNPFWRSLVFVLATITISNAFVMRTSPSTTPTTTSSLEVSTTSSTEQTILSVELEKPLGIILEEVEQGQAKGVFVLELAEEGSAAASEFKDQLVGLPLAKVMGNDVTNLDFDSVMEQLIAAPSPINIEFIVAASTSSTTQEESSSSPPAAEEIDDFPIGTTVAIKVLDDKGNPETVIEAKVGDNLRETLLANNIEVYQGLKQKLGNCGGGGQCTFCAAEFVESEGWSERSEYEDKRLAKAPKARLSCLNNIQGPATIRLV
jgi:ferredoxin